MCYPRKPNPFYMTIKLIVVQEVEFLPRLIWSKEKIN